MGYISECPEGMGLCSRAHASERRDVPGLFAKRGRCLTRHLVASPQYQSSFNHCRFNPIPTRCLPGTPHLSNINRAHVALAAPCTGYAAPCPPGIRQGSILTFQPFFATVPFLIATESQSRENYAAKAYN